jgi:hypothetical protein
MPFSTFIRNTQFSSFPVFSSYSISRSSFSVSAISFLTPFNPLFPLFKSCFVASVFLFPQLVKFISTVLTKWLPHRYSVTDSRCFAGSPHTWFKRVTAELIVSVEASEKACLRKVNYDVSYSL